MSLTDHPLTQPLVQLPRRGASIAQHPTILLRDDGVALLDALVADLDGRTRDQLLDFPLTLPAERTGKIRVIVAILHAFLLPPGTPM